MSATNNIRNFEIIDTAGINRKSKLSDAIDQELNKQPSGLIARLQRAADDLDRANPVDVCKFGILSLMPQLQLLILKIESL